MSWIWSSILQEELRTCEESWKDARGEVNKEVDIGMTYWYPAVCGLSGRLRVRCFRFRRRGRTTHNDVWTECDLSWGLQKTYQRWWCLDQVWPQSEAGSSNPWHSTSPHV